MHQSTRLFLPHIVPEWGRVVGLAGGPETKVLVCLRGKGATCGQHAASVACRNHESGGKEPYFQGSWLKLIPDPELASGTPCDQFPYLSSKAAVRGFITWGHLRVKWDFWCSYNLPFPFLLGSCSSAGNIWCSQAKVLWMILFPRVSPFQGYSHTTGNLWEARWSWR